MVKPKKLVGYERKCRMIELRQNGHSLAAIAIAFGVSKTRVTQILADVKFKRAYLPVNDTTSA